MGADYPGQGFSAWVPFRVFLSHLLCLGRENRGGQGNVLGSEFFADWKRKEGGVTSIIIGRGDYLFLIDSGEAPPLHRGTSYGA